MSQLRADFQQCVEPSDALTGSCIQGYQNEGNDCGFQYNLEGLCAYCGTSSLNSTDSCCETSRSQTRCANVKLPVFSYMSMPFTTTATATATPTPSSASASATAHSTSRKGLSGGAIAGIVIGSVVGAALILALLVFCCLFMRHRQRQREESSLNQPTPPLSRGKSKKGEKFEAAPGARVTRMAALEASSGSSMHNRGSSHYQTPTDGAKTPRSAAGFGAIAVSRRDKSMPREPVPNDDSSPESQGYSSGDGAATGQSEQMDAFKDYYSNDDIHPGDAVSTLWAYSPRANDEFELERGDMLRIVGIWDDGWATGVRINDRAEDWEPGRSAHRDSGVSGNGAEASPPARGEVKAFPVSAVQRRVTTERVLTICDSWCACVFRSTGRRRWTEMSTSRTCPRQTARNEEDEEDFLCNHHDTATTQQKKRKRKRRLYVLYPAARRPAKRDGFCSCCWCLGHGGVGKTQMKANLAMLAVQLQLIDSTSDDDAWWCREASLP